jgi:hypothetical protein
MSFTLTTTSASVGINDTTVLLASLTGITPGILIGIENEVMKVQIQGVPTSATVPVPVLRGQEGTEQKAHPISAQVKIGSTQTSLVAADWTQPQAGSSSIAAFPANFPRQFLSYSANGAITLPRIGQDMFAILNGGTGALAMTLANPTTEQDGSRLVVMGNGKAAHTITYAAGLGNVGGTADVITFSASQQQAIELVACGGFWLGMGMNTAVAGAGATINGVGLG